MPDVLGYRFFCVFLCAKISFMNETVITLFGAIDRYWYNKNYLKYFLDKAKGQPVRLKSRAQTPYNTIPFFADNGV